MYKKNFAHVFLGHYPKKRQCQEIFDPPTFFKTCHLYGCTPSEQT